MPYTQPLDQLTSNDQPAAGQKAVNLGELIRAGFNTPRGFVVTADAYRDAFTAAQLNQKIAARLAQTQMDDPLELEENAKEIREWVETIPLPPALAQEIETALNELSSHLPSATRYPHFAVRSSLVAEDIPNPNATRVPRAHLGVRADNVLDVVRQVWSILWDTRRIYYRHRKKIDANALAIAAIVQPMIDTDAAGVMFTASPRSGAVDEIHIDSTWGLGESVVSARRSPDRFVVAKSTREIRERSIANKTVKEIVASAGGVESVGVADADQDAPSLSDAHLLALADLGARVEAHFKSPQDIEWGRKGEEFFVVQARGMKQREA